MVYNILDGHFLFLFFICHPVQRSHAYVDVVNQYHRRLPLSQPSLTLIQQVCRTEGEQDGDCGGQCRQQQFLDDAAAIQVAPELGHLEFHVHNDSFSLLRPICLQSYETFLNYGAIMVLK